jgi:hypothetical protein
MAPRKGKKGGKKAAKKSAARKKSPAKRSRKSAAAKPRRRIIKTLKYSSKKYGCYGAQVKAGKGKKETPRVFCSRVEKKKK